MKSNVYDYLLDEKHLKRFLEIVEIAPQFEDDKNYAPAGYLLTATQNILNKVKKYITDDGIFFQKMLSKCDLVPGELPVVKIAYDLFSGGSKGNNFSLTDLDYSDYEHIKAVIKAVELYFDLDRLEFEYSDTVEIELVP